VDGNLEKDFKNNFDLALSGIKYSERDLTFIGMPTQNETFTVEALNVMHPNYDTGVFELNKSEIIV
jgi:hypothetical protein